MDEPAWFKVDEVGHGVLRLRETGLGIRDAANIWLVVGRDAAVLVDTGVGVAPLRPVIEALTDRPVICVLTHSHYDHVGGAWEFADRRAHRAEAAILADPTPERTMWEGWLTDASFTALPHPLFSMAHYSLHAAPPTGLLDEGDRLDLGDRRLIALHVPGHSPGLIALYDPSAKLLFTSDALYQGEMFFDLPGSDRGAARRSIERIASLPAATVHPGHGESFDAVALHSLAEATMRSLEDA